MPPVLINGNGYKRYNVYARNGYAEKVDVTVKRETLIGRILNR